MAKEGVSTERRSILDSGAERGETAAEVIGSSSRLSLGERVIMNGLAWRRRTAVSSLWWPLIDLDSLQILAWMGILRLPVDASSSLSGRGICPHPMRPEEARRAAQTPIGGP